MAQKLQNFREVGLRFIVLNVLSVAGMQGFTCLGVNQWHSGCCSHKQQPGGVGDNSRGRAGLHIPISETHSYEASHDSG